MVLNQTFVGFENPSQAMMPKVGHPLKPFATGYTSNRLRLNALTFI